MTAGVPEILIVVLVALLLFGPAAILAWGGYMMGRRKGREEGAAEARAEMTQGEHGTGTDDDADDETHGETIDE